LTVTQVKLLKVQFPTAMTDTKSLNTSWLDVMISSKTQCVFIRDLSYITLQIIFDGLWAAMDLGSNRPFGWDNF
jgi:hypothetical protein